MRIAAELLDTGIDLPLLNRSLFRTVPFHKLKLHSLAVGKTQLYEYGRVGISFITLEEIAPAARAARTRKASSIPFAISTPSRSRRCCGRATTG